MEKRISYSEFQSVKSVAKSCDPMITKRNKLKAKIEELARSIRVVMIISQHLKQVLLRLLDSV